METISLPELLKRYWKVADSASYPDGTAAVESVRNREYALRKFLPMGVVHRLDSCFWRSNTVHPDTGHALYVIGRAMRPSHIFETGTYWGYSTAYLAAAVRDNGAGKVHTFDIYPHAGKHFPKALRPQVTFYKGKPSTEMMPPVLEQLVPDLFFQDSRHDYEGVVEELEVVSPLLKPGAVVLFHDFAMPDVPRAASDVLQGYTFYIVETNDPQQLGVAIKNAG